MGGAAVFVTGALAMGFLVSSVFFLRFWRRTGDSLFLVFAAAFALMALNQGLIGVFDVPREEQSPIFALRLLAFVLIIAAILWKNVGGRRS
ncbi:MAG: DUF5985 family protein [Pseudomonadota bacterium]|nr:DUF5985 family protein [Pseudomonadota bacterium]